MNSQTNVVTNQTNQSSTSTLLSELELDGRFVIDKLDEWALKIGEKPCFYYGEDNITLTFSDFSKLTDAIAGNLARHGVVKGDPVSVFLGNPLVTTLSMFAIWKVGAVYCPINFGFSGSLLSYQINDTKPKFIFTERVMVSRLNELVDRLPDIEGVIIYDAPKEAHDFVVQPVALNVALRELSWNEFLIPSSRPIVHAKFDDVANILYTSGTTGPSKGVVQTHRWMNQYTFVCRMMLTSDDIVYNDLPLYHVGGAIFNIVRAIWMGCTIVCWDRFSTTDFWTRIRKTGASTAALIDTMIPWLLKSEITPNDRNHSLNKVHMQPLPKYHEEMARRFGLDFISVGFGQTESGMSFFAIIEETDKESETPVEFHRGLSRNEMHAMARRYCVPCVKPHEADRKGYMGSPSIFVSATAFDEQESECKPGKIGQLALRPKLPGMFLLEYLHKPDVTILAFRNLWFHTGDLVRLDTDGKYIFVDRMGDRIRVRGENVSSFEIEDIANQFSGVVASAAFPVPAEIGEEDDIALCVEITKGSIVSEAQFSDWLALKMPKFMRPRYVRLMETLPRTATQKIEKYKLKSMVLTELGRSPRA